MLSLISLAVHDTTSSRSSHSAGFYPRKGVINFLSHTVQTAGFSKRFAPPDLPRSTAYHFSFTHVQSPNAIAADIKQALQALHAAAGV